MVNSLHLILILQCHDVDDEDDNNKDELTVLVGTSTLLLGMILHDCMQDDTAACGPAMSKEEGGKYM
jgi:hypothetical protein